MQPFRKCLESVAVWVMIGAFAIIYIPIHVLSGIDNRRQEERRLGLRPPRSAETPRGINIRRRRRAITSTEGVAQSRSRLLSKLPVEIRQLIWRMSLGNMTIHLFNANSMQGPYFGSRVCSTPSLSPYLDHDECQRRARQERPKIQLISLLRACKQM